MAPKGYSADVGKLLSNLKDFFEREKLESKSIMINNINVRMEMATGIPRQTISRLLKPKKLCQEKYSSNKIHIDDFDRRAIIRKVHQFYQRREFPTLDKLLAVIRKDLNFTGGRTTLWKFLKKMGFKFKKRDGRKFLVQRPEIVALRHRYLRRMKKVRSEKPNSNIIYLDETWINANHTPSKCWVDEDGKGGIATPLGKGQRLIIVHAGNCDGFVPDAELNFISKNTGDYHNEMNGKHFEEWIDTKVFPNIPENSVVIMDNASYHSVQIEKIPNMSNVKSEMQNWLKNNNISYSSTATKKELDHLIKLHKPPSPKYKIDELAKKYGHEIIRLPPYHPDLNPIELIWSQVKNKVATNNKDFKIKSVQKLFEETLPTITETDWQNAIKHVIGIEQSYWSKENIIDIDINQVIIKLMEDSESDSQPDSD